MTITDLLALLIVMGEWTGLARGILGAPYYAAVLDVVLVGLVAVIAVRAFRRRELWPLPLIAILAAAFMVLSAVEILNPNVPRLIVGVEGYRKTAFTMLALFVILFGGAGNPRRFYTIVAIGSLPAFLWAIRQAFLPLPVDLAIIETTSASPISFHSGAILRSFSPTAGPFHLGILAAIVMIIAVLRSRGRSPGWMLLAMVAGITLGLTITRASIAAGVVSLVVVAALAARWRERFRIAAAGIGPVLAALGAALVVVGAVSVSPDIAEPSRAAVSGEPAVTVSARPDVVDVADGVANPLEDRSLQFRFGFWREYLAAIAERPIIGYGTSSAGDGFDHLYAGTGSRNFEPHSLYFKAALELGIGGLLLLLAVLGVGLWRSFARLRHDRELALMALGIQLVVLVSGVTGPMLDAYPVNLLFWATVGWMARPLFLARTQSAAATQ